MANTIVKQTNIVSVSVNISCKQTNNFSVNANISVKQTNNINISIKQTNISVSVSTK